MRHARDQRHNRVKVLRSALLYTSPVLLAAAVYGYSITLPFFLDDGPHFQIRAQTNGLQQWGDFHVFPFYRPFTFTFWKVTESILGGYQAPVMHAFSVLTFGLCAVLIGQIVRRLATPSAGLLAGYAFVLFPYSYQAVAMVAAFFHLTLTLGILVCVWTALLWLDGRVGLPGLMVCWAAAFMAVFSHENGLLLPVLLVGLLLVVGGQPSPLNPLSDSERELEKSPHVGLHPISRMERGPGGEVRFDSRRDWLLLVLPVIMICCVYGLLWLAFRPQETNGLTDSLVGAMATLLQGLAYPFVVMLRPFFEGDVQAGLLLVIVAVPVLLIFAWAVWRQSHMIRVLLFGLAWYILAIFPAALVLPAGYVLGQPRLALLASVGGSIFWAVALTSISPPKTLMSVGALFIIIAVFGWISLEFLGMRRAEFLHLRDFNREAVRLLDANHAIETGAVMVNVPDYITPPEEDRRFLLGTEGVLFVDETLDYDQQFWMNSEHDYHNIEVFAYPRIQRNEGFGFRAHPPELDGLPVIDHVRDAAQVVVTQFDGRAFYPALVGGTAFAGDSEALARYPEVDYALTDAAAIYDEQDAIVETSIRWRISEPEALKTFVHVYCDDAFIAQSDGYPWGDTYPFSAWQSGEIQTDIRQIRLQTQVDAACLHVYTGLYREADVTRLRAVNAQDGERYQDDLFPVPVQLSGEEIPGN